MTGTNAERRTGGVGHVPGQTREVMKRGESERQREEKGCIKRGGRDRWEKQ